MSQLIIIRGNSASGKSTLAKAFQEHFPRGTVMKIAQDDVRLGKDRKENSTADCIQLLAEFGKDNFDIVLIEGILKSDIYKEMFKKCYQIFNAEVYTYYYDIPFEETVIRHAQREKSKTFGAERMKEWWLEKDFLNFPNEKIITQEMTTEQVLNLILSDIGRSIEK